MAVQSFGSGLKRHVHFHTLTSDGVWFPDGSYYALGHCDQDSLLTQLRHSILKFLVARNCLQLETARLLESWPLDRSGFSAFVGDPISQPADRPRLERVLNYILKTFASAQAPELRGIERTGALLTSPSPRQGLGTCL